MFCWKNENCASVLKRKTFQLKGDNKGLQKEIQKRMKLLILIGIVLFICDSSIFDRFFIKYVGVVPLNL